MHTIDMSKRLQVLLDDDEMEEISRLARQQRTTVADWVRRALRAARSSQPSATMEKKLQAIRAAIRNTFPAEDIGTMLKEIDSGYLQGQDQ